MIELFALTGADVGRSFQVDAGARLGRGEQCEVNLRDRSVSRTHARLERDAYGCWWIVDAGSRNGVFVAGDTETPRRIPGTLATEVPMRAVIERAEGYPCAFSGEHRRLGDGAYAVRWDLPPVPSQVAPGAVLRIPVKVTNLGDDIWPDRNMADAGAPGGWAVRLTHRWRSA